MSDTTWVHSLDPFLLEFSTLLGPNWAGIGIRWYGLAYVMGFVCGFLIMKWFSQKKISPITVEQASDFLTALILGVLIGGRLGYALFYSPQLFTDFRADFPFWGLLAVNEGGMASHGGFIGVFMACAYFSWKHKIQFPHLGDLTIIGATIGIGLGRIANFINGELMGKVASPDLAWAVKFPQDIYRWIGYEPENLRKLKKPAELLGISPSEFRIWTDNIGAYKSKFYGMAGEIIGRIQNGDEVMTQAMREILDPRHPSQIYAFFTEAFIPFLIIMLIWRKPLKPGIVGSTYIIIYGIGRIFNEQFRLPDAHIANLAEQPLGISRGQFISIWLILLGVIFMIWSLKRKAEPLGGWAQKGA